MPFYQTVPLFPIERKEAELKTVHQDDLVIEAFRKLNMPMGPSMVYKYLINRGKITHKVPITSIRRSITSLTKDGLLVKTDKTVMGNWGMREHLWKINTNH